MYSKPASDPGQSSFRSICGSQLGLERFCINFKDIATIHRSYIDPTKNDIGVNEQPALGVDMETHLGMIPLLQDGFFVAMAVTIMFGLGFATVLTLVFVPVLYATFFKIPYKEIPT